MRSCDIQLSVLTRGFLFMYLFTFVRYNAWQPKHNYTVFTLEKKTKMEIGSRYKTLKKTWIQRKLTTLQRGGQKSRATYQGVWMLNGSLPIWYGVRGIDIWKDLCIVFCFKLCTKVTRRRCLLSPRWSAMLQCCSKKPKRNKSVGRSCGVRPWYPEVFHLEFWTDFLLRHFLLGFLGLSFFGVIPFPFS